MTTAQLLFSAWEWHPSVVVGCAGLAAGYVLAWRRGGARIGAGLVGVAVLLLALVSPLDVLADRYLFSAHMLQHLALAVVVPPLLLLGAPAIARRLVPRVPLALAWITGVATLVAWHAPALYDAAVRVEWLHVVQHLTFLASGVVFWYPVAAPAAETRLAEGARGIYLLTACMANSVVGIVITLAPIGTYAAYARPDDALDVLALLRDGWGMSPATDQAVGGLLMWVGGCLVYVVALLAGLVRWLGGERLDAADTAAT
jgi:cytochrome c oxidase assembly factor CtaG